MAQKVDGLIKELVPGIQYTTKWHKPSQPLGVPFYGLPDKGWIIALWSFKNEFAIGFIAGSLLDTEPPVTKMAGPGTGTQILKQEGWKLKTNWNLMKNESAPGLNKPQSFQAGQKLNSKGNLNIGLKPTCKFPSTLGFP